MAAWSTSVLASSIDRSVNGSARRRRTSSTTASISPRTVSGSSSAQPVGPDEPAGLDEEPTSASRGTLVASSLPSAARKPRPVLATQLTPGGRSSRGVR